MSQLIRAIRDNNLSEVYSIVDSNPFLVTPDNLFQAVNSGANPNIILALLQSGVDPNSKYIYNNSIIMTGINALKRGVGSIHTIQYLLDYGAVYQYGDYDNAIDLLEDFYEKEGSIFDY